MSRSRLQFGDVKKLFLSDRQSHSGRTEADGMDGCLFLLLFVCRFHHFPLQHDPNLTWKRTARQRGAVASTHKRHRARRVS